MEVNMADRTGIYRIVADCERYWRETKVPRSRAKEMAAELQSHLLMAEAEGKTPEAVVGSDLAAFAEEWASEYRGPASPDAWRAANRRAITKKEIKRAYGWLAGVAVLVVLLAIFGPKEDSVDVEMWRWIWIGVAIVLGIGELLTAGLFMLPFAIGAVAAGVLAFFNVPVWLQIVVFLGTSVAALFGMRRFARDEQPLHPVGAKRFVGAAALVTEPIDRVAGTGRVRMQTEIWRATTDLDMQIEPGTEVKVLEVRGARLVVEPTEADMS
jgi:membrane protein implicated in regulation of membrane protease activity